MRKVIDDFRVDVRGQVKRLEGGAKADLQRKHTSLLAFDYEAAARLKAWDSLGQIIKVRKPDDDLVGTQLTCASRNPKTLKIPNCMDQLQTSRFLLKHQATASLPSNCLSPTKLTPNAVMITTLQVKIESLTYIFRNS